MSEYVEIYKCDDGWRWQLKGGNHEIMATGESHKTKWGVKRAIHRIHPTIAIKERR